MKTEDIYIYCHIMLYFINATEQISLFPYIITRDRELVFRIVIVR